MDGEGGGFSFCHLALTLTVTPPFFPCLSSCNHPFIQHTYLHGHVSGDDAGIRKIQMMKEECDELASEAYIVLMFYMELGRDLSNTFNIILSVAIVEVPKQQNTGKTTQSGPAEHSEVFLFNILW